MADLTSSAVTVVTGWIAPTTGVRMTTKRLTLVLTGQGDGTDTIDASTLGFSKIFDCSNAITSNNGAVYPATPSYDGSKIFFTNLAQASDASRPAPATVTGVTVRLTVTGATP